MGTADFGMKERMEIFSKPDLLRPKVTILLLVLGVVSFVGAATGFGATGTEAITSLIGAEDSLLVVDPNGSIIISKNDAKKLIPASTLKIFTALVALHYLGPEHLYRTEFFIDNQIVDDGRLAQKGGQKVGDFPDNFRS